MKTEIKNYIMNKYLSFEDSEDRIYSNPSSTLEQDSEYGDFSFRDKAALKANQAKEWVKKKGIFSKTSTINEKSQGADKKKVKEADKEGQKHVKNEVRKLEPELTENAKNQSKRIANQVAETSVNKSRHKAAVALIKKAKLQSAAETGIHSIKKNEENVRKNKDARNKWAAGQKAAQVAKHRGAATIGGAAVGGALGVGAGHLASKSARKELAALHARGIQSDADHYRADQLRKKISNAKLAGGAIGAVGGLIAGRKINKSIAHKKAGKAIKYHLRNGSANYKKEQTLNSSKYM